MGFFENDATNFKIYCAILDSPITDCYDLPAAAELGSPPGTPGGMKIESFPEFIGRVFNGTEGWPEIGDVVRVTFNGQGFTRGYYLGRTGAKYLPGEGGSISPPPSGPFGALGSQAGMIGGGSCVEGTGAAGSVRFTYNELKILRPPLQELLEYIAAHESRGNYNAVNRGVGGDTRGGSKPLIGKELTELTIGELLSYMKGGSRAAETGVGGKTEKHPNGTVGFLATGKYQMIPVTLRSSISSAGVSEGELYNVETQETLGVYLLLKKRPKLGKYLLGISNDECGAAQSAALEWASLPLQYARSNGCQRGYSAYCVGGANATGKLSRSPEEVISVLRSARSKVLQNSSSRQLIASKGYEIQEAVV